MNTFVKRLLIFLVSIAIVAVAGFLLLPTNAHFGMLTMHPSPAIAVAQSSFSYNGQNGKDALTLLKEKTLVVQDKTGMVTSINSKSVNASKHEYWAFYINGNLALVGPASYKTKNNDIILWKIETY